MPPQDPIKIDISTLSPDGCGYSADGRFAVYGALPGETVTAQVISRKRKRKYARAIAVENPADNRVDPFCSAAAFCGGCSFQHLDHAAQIEMKQAHLAETLSPLEPEEWLPPIVGEPVNYRSKARLGVKFVLKKDRVLVGFREKQKPYIAETQSCPILVESVSTLIEPLMELIASMSEPATIPQIELSSGDEVVALIFRHLGELTEGDLVQLADFGQRHNVRMYLQPGGLDSVHPVTAGDDSMLSFTIPERGIKLEFGLHDFTQVNLAINRQMIGRVLMLLEPEPEDVVFDAFCGIGNFSLSIARSVKEVYGAELSATSIDRARHNATLNNIENCTFETQDLHQKGVDIQSLRKFRKVVLDPPRSGAEELVKVLASSDVSRVVYVSCNPDTLARDAQILVDLGFRLRSAGIIDMFPHTTHVESVALLTR